MVISNMVPIGSIFNFLHMHNIYKLYFSVCEKRMTSGWFTYALVELKQRYRIEGPISSNIDEALSDYHCEIRDGFYIFWGRHKCQVDFFFISTFSMLTNNVDLHTILASYLFTNFAMI